MFERFTDQARKVVIQAQAEAHGGSVIRPEHLLIGLVQVVEGPVAKVFEALGLSLEKLPLQIEESLGKLGDTGHAGYIPFSPEAKKVFEFSLREALQLGHNYIGTEHILLGLTREGSVNEFLAPYSEVRREVVAMLRQTSPIQKYELRRNPVTEDGQEQNALQKRQLAVSLQLHRFAASAKNLEDTLKGLDPNPRQKILVDIARSQVTELQDQLLNLSEGQPPKSEAPLRALAGEFGELAKAVNNGDNLRPKLLRLASLCLAWLEEIEDS